MAKKEVTKDLTTVKGLLSDERYVKRFSEILNRNPAGFFSSIINITQSSDMLKNADPNSIIGSALVAATLNLPIDKNLGFAWIVPYNVNIGTKQKPEYVSKAQFQMGWKGFVQLAFRTGQYKKINAVPVYENQLKDKNVIFNSLTEELNVDFTKQGEGSPIGYACYFQLVNGFEKIAYWPKEKVERHGKKYSKTYSSSTSSWVTSFDEMALKTVIKNTLAKWGILSVEMQKAQMADQSIVKETETDEIEFEYVDNDQGEIKEVSEQKADEKIFGTGTPKEQKQMSFDDTPEGE